MTFGERLTELRKEKGYATRNEFADRLKIPSTTLRNYETDAREPGHTFLKQISEMFNVSVDYLLCLTDDKEKVSSYQLRNSEYEHIQKYRTLDTHGHKAVDSILDIEYDRCQQKQDRPDLTTIQQDIRTIQYYQRLASAGSGEYLFDDIPTDTITVENTPISSEADFVIGVNGQSMEPTYYDGDLVFAKKASKIPVGEIGIFTKGDECFIKELGPDRLISHNADKARYPDVFPDEEIRLVGLVLGKAEKI